MSNQIPGNSGDELQKWFDEVMGGDDDTEWISDYILKASDDDEVWKWFECDVDGMCVVLGWFAATKTRSSSKLLAWRGPLTCITHLVSTNTRHNNEDQFKNSTGDGTSDRHDMLKTSSSEATSDRNDTFDNKEKGEYLFETLASEGTSDWDDEASQFKNYWR